jgi:uncharacterized damage-inducible protein DinB
MNSFIEQQGEVLKETFALRSQIMAILSDADLAYRPTERSRTLGDLCREIGEVETSYIHSFKTLKQDWSHPYRAPDPAIATSVDRLRAWYQALDDELMGILVGFSEADLQKTIDRGWPVGMVTQVHIYREALLIFAAKAVVYLEALGKPIPKHVQAWIG